MDLRDPLNRMGAGYVLLFANWEPMCCSCLVFEFAFEMNQVFDIQSQEAVEGSNV